MTTTTTRAALQPDDLMAAARQETGFSDFGEDDFREPLALLCRSLAEEAPLTAEGLQAHRQRLIGTLSDRLRLQAWFERRPEIADEDVGAPVVGSSRVDLQACKLEYSIVSPK